MGNLGFQELLLIFVLLGVLVPFILFLVTLQNSLKIVSPENRKMEPGVVWVLLVPFLSTIFMFFVANAIGASFKREFERYGVFQEAKPTYGAGLALAVAECCYIFSTFGFYVPLITGLLGLAILVLWIVYWVQVNQKKNELKRMIDNNSFGTGEKSIFL